MDATDNTGKAKTPKQATGTNDDTEWRPPARPPTGHSGRMGPPSLPPKAGMRPSQPSSSVPYPCLFVHRHSRVSVIAWHRSGG